MPSIRGPLSIPDMVQNTRPFSARGGNKSVVSIPATVALGPLGSESSRSHLALRTVDTEKRSAGRTVFGNNVSPPGLTD